MKKAKPILIIVGGILVIFVAFRFLKGNSDPAARRENIPIVRIESPKQETVTEVLKYTGDILPISQANIYSKVSGNLEKLYVDIGMRVGNNQLLALIDTTELYQQYQQAAATYENARLLYERNKELFNQNLIARQDLDNADAAMKVSKASFDNARTKLDYARITSPFAGTVTKRFLDQGANITANNTSLFVVMDMEAMKVTIDVPEKNIPLVTTGKKAIITVDAYPGRVFEGKVSRLSQAVDLSTRTMEVQIDIPNHDRLLKPGMFANVSLIVREQPNSITVPTPALQSDDKGSYVYVVEGPIAHRRGVSVGLDQDGRTQILSGISLADHIVTVGMQFVKDGGQVSIQQ